MKKIAIITARSGSKGLRDKNIIDLCGKPLLSYSIDAALKSNFFDRTIVTTDSEKYAEIARGYGAEIFMRGDSLSNDTATSFMVIEDVLNRLEEKPDYFVLLQPTSPLRNSKHILNAVEIFQNKYNAFDFMVSVKEAEHVGSLVKPLAEEKSMKNFDTDFSTYARQRYKEYSPNGAIFIGKTEAYLEQKHFYGKRSSAYIMSKEDSVDIDDLIDFELAKIIMKRRMLEEVK